MSPIQIHVFLHGGDTDRLTEISKKLSLLILLHKDEGQLKAVADKLGMKTEALAAVLQEQQPKKE